MPHRAIRIEEIMTRDPVCLNLDANIHDAHRLMKQVKHLPIVDDDGKLCGVLSQRKIVATVISLLNKYGPGVLDRKERFVSVRDVMEPPLIHHPEELAADVIDHFVVNKLSCLPVVDHDGKVCGILTASDFLLLCRHLMDQADKDD